MIETLESKSPLFRGSLSAHIINLRTFIVFIATFLGWRSNFDIGWGRGGGGSGDHEHKTPFLTNPL